MGTSGPLVDRATDFKMIFALLLLQLVLYTVQGAHFLIETTNDTTLHSGVPKMIRGPVNQTIVVGDCSGEEDGTKCFLPCRAMDCIPEGGARCYEGTCRQGGDHPCISEGSWSLEPDNPCCCGDCSKPQDHLRNLKFCGKDWKKEWAKQFIEPRSKKNGGKKEWPKKG